MRVGRRTGRWAAVALLSFAFAAPALAAPKVVATIAPLHALAAQVMQGAGAPALLIAGATDPHDFQLRPSQAAALAEAELVLWIGPALEGGLARPLAALVRPGAALALSARPEIALLPARRGGLFGRGHDLGADPEHAIDPHLWLDPANARAILLLLAAELGRRDPANAALYAANASAGAARLEALEAVLVGRLAPVIGRAFVVQHDALQYFEHRFGLAALGAMSVAPEEPPGAARLLALDRAIAASGARCVFVQPQASAALARKLAAGAGARVAVLDDLGAEIPPGPDAYDRLMTGIADALLGCLGP